MKLLAIDFGLKHLGLAIAEANLAQPYLALKVSDQVQAINRLSQICQKEKITKIILGLPEGALAYKVKDFGEELKKITKLPLVFTDETLTSKEAIQKMIEAGKPKKFRQKSDHLFSACLILQNYLDQ